jgi:predicted amidohydrolase
MNKCTIAVAQIDTILGDLKKNVAKHVEVLHRAKEGGADLIVFPELSLTGYSIKDLNWNLALRIDDKNALSPLAVESEECSLLCGAVEESPAYGMYNSAFLFENGNGRSVHRKIYPPSYGMFEEARYFSRGTSVRAFDSVIGRVGVLICEDLWHISLPYLLALDGAEVIICIAASPTRLSGSDPDLQISQVNSEQHRAMARLLSTYIVFCNRVGYEDGVNFWGGSEVISPDGEVALRAKLFEEDLIFTEMDSNDVRRARRLSRHFLDENISLTLSELERIAGIHR